MATLMDFTLKKTWNEILSPSNYSIFGWHSHYLRILFLLWESISAGGLLLLGCSEQKPLRMLEPNTSVGEKGHFA